MPRVGDQDNQIATTKTAAWASFGGKSNSGDTFSDADPMTEAGEAALKRFHEWCRAEGVTYDEEVSPSRDTNPDKRPSSIPHVRPLMTRRPIN